MIKYKSEQEAANALAIAYGWHEREGWSMEWASECQCWFRGDTLMVEKTMFRPFSDTDILKCMRTYDLNIKPTYKKIRGQEIRFWHVQSTRGAYRKHFQSEELYDALAQWLIGHMEFMNILRQKVDLV